MLTALVIKIGAQETASVIFPNWVKSNYITPPLVFSCKVIEQMAVRQWCELAVWAIGAFIFPFVAKIGIPFPFAHRLIARLFTCFTIPSFGKHVAPTLEQTLKNGNFFFQTISDNWGRCHIFFEANIFGGVRYAIFVENRSQPGIFSL